MAQANTVLTVMLICVAQFLNLIGNIWGVKCNKVVDFLKSGHKYTKTDNANLCYNLSPRFPRT